MYVRFTTEKNRVFSNTLDHCTGMFTWNLQGEPQNVEKKKERKKEELQVNEK